MIIIDQYCDVKGEVTGKCILVQVDIAKEINLSHENIETILKLKKIQSHTSLDAPLNEDGDDDFYSLLNILKNENSPSPDQQTNIDFLKLNFTHILKKLLTKKELKVIEMYFGINRNYEMGLEDIAKELGITREGVRTTKTRALNKLKSLYPKKLFKQYLRE